MRTPPVRHRRALALVPVVVALAGCSSSGHPARAPQTPTSVGAAAGIHKIKHVVIVMQENRSFDSYFGTFPGADGFPSKNGVITVCLPRRDRAGGCVKPFHDSRAVDGGGAHTHRAAVADINGGKMDGFVRTAEASARACRDVQNPECAHDTGSRVMGYHDAREIPNYWKYAKDFVLDDHMFEPVTSWSLPAHLYMVSAWSAHCSSRAPSSCRNNIVGPTGAARQERMVNRAIATGTAPVHDAWTDITYLLYKQHVSWGYYVEKGGQPDCANDAATCAYRPMDYRTPGIWNPLPLFGDVQADGQLANVQPTQNFFAAAKAGTLPAVSWITPSQVHSEHPPATVHDGQAWVTGIVNSIMRGPDWNSTAIFVSWDDWGGFYDHVVPPTIDGNGYGLRVPGLVISPYAKRGYIDHQTLSHDAFLKFIEDDFLGGARLDPKTDGRPDPRPTVRENAAQLGDLANDFDFTQRPRAPEILPPVPPPRRA